VIWLLSKSLHHPPVQQLIRITTMIWLMAKSLRHLPVQQLIRITTMIRLLSKSLHHPPVQQLIRILLTEEELHHHDDDEDHEKGDHHKKAQPLQDTLDKRSGRRCRLLLNNQWHLTNLTLIKKKIWKFSFFPHYLLFYLSGSRLPFLNVRLGSCSSLLRRGNRSSFIVSSFLQLLSAHMFSLSESNWKVFSVFTIQSIKRKKRCL
jgi:hypothetical protein